MTAAGGRRADEGRAGVLRAVVGDGLAALTDADAAARIETTGVANLLRSNRVNRAACRIIRLG
jgi:hypothetical protein